MVTCLPGGRLPEALKFRKGKSRVQIITALPSVWPLPDRNGTPRSFVTGRAAFRQFHPLCLFRSRMWNSGAVTIQRDCAEPRPPTTLQQQHPVPLGHLCPRRLYSQGTNNSLVFCFGLVCTWFPMSDQSWPDCPVMNACMQWDWWLCDRFHCSRECDTQLDSK